MNQRKLIPKCVIASDHPDSGTSMSGAKMTFPELPGWVFEVDEVSAGVFRVRGCDQARRSVEATGIDPDRLFAYCRSTAGRMNSAEGLLMEARHEHR